MLVVDGSNILHSVLHTELGKLQALDGTATGGIHGVLSSLAHSLRSLNVDDCVVVAWDNGVPLHRRELNCNYKPNKKITMSGGVPKHLLPSESEVDVFDESSEVFLEKYRYARDKLHQFILPRLGCMSLLVENCEADDIISHIVKKVDDLEIVIQSADKDLLQLVSDENNVSQYDSIRKRWFYEEDIIEKWNLSEDIWKEQYILMKAIDGDPSDNIKGVPQVGAKPASNYAEQILRGTEYCDLVRPPRGRMAGLDNLKEMYDEVENNRKIKDLNYPVENNLKIVKDIERAIKSTSLVDMDSFAVEEFLHDKQMNKAKESVWEISEICSGFDNKDILRRFL